MAQGERTGLFRVALIVFAVASFVYGAGFLVVPGFWVDLNGGDLVDYGWLRWPGGFLIALAIGAVSIARKPENQGVFAFIIALSTLLGGLGLLFSLIMGEYTGAYAFIAVPTGIMLLNSGFLWWGIVRGMGGL